MKSNFFIYFFWIFSFCITSNVTHSSEINFEGEEIIVSDNGNIITSKKGIIIKDGDQLEIIGEEFVYNKKLQIVNVSKNVKLIDKINNIVIEAPNVIYFKNEERIITKGKTFIKFNEGYFAETKDLIFNKNKNIIKSNNLTVIKDNFKNKLTLNKFDYLINESTIKGKSAIYVDNLKNEYVVDDVLADLSNNKLLGKDVNIDFHNSILGNNENQPRLSGRSIEIENDISIINKGVFTTCKKRKDKCPPWVMSAEEVNHDKKKKQISYKNAWLKVYDTPVLYFPKFYHPDPTVKRQSGFLVPKFSDSLNFGQSINIPYYYMISENRDATITPTLFSKNNLILQTEYRERNNRSSHDVDFSFNRKKNIAKFVESSQTNTHFFSSSNFEYDLESFDQSTIDINIQRTSHDTYLKAFDLASNTPLINDTTTLRSNVKFDFYRENLFLETDFQAYENLTKDTTDRYEFIYPEISLTKNFETELNGNLVLDSNGYQKKYNTNISETVMVNNIIYNSNNSFLDSGLQNKYTVQLKNVNSSANNSTKYKSHSDSNLLSEIMFQSKYPLKKLGARFNNFLTPIASFRASPNKTKNIKNEDRRIDSNNVFSLNRIGNNDTVEGGYSLTVGNEYMISDKNKNELALFKLATVYRAEVDEDLPLQTTIGNKSSDIFGNLTLKPSDVLGFKYNFSLDNSLDRSNYNAISTDVNLNNFVTSFEYLEENNFIGKKRILSNETTFKFDNSNSLSFETRKDLKHDLTEFYNLIYEYKNDCLIAAIEYNKSYYQDNDIQPEKNLFFSITIVPYGKTNSPNLNQ